MLTEGQIKDFETNGYAVFKQLITLEQCEQLKESIKNLVDQWDPEKEHSCAFGTGENREQSRNQYFLESADKISFFLEEGAMDPNTRSLNRDKHVSVNKIGHALHTKEPSFKKVSFSKEIKGILKDLNFGQPAICQSMVIFKQPFIGGEVTPHQDGTFLYNEPLKIMGVWIALEDATLENGCLWFIPGSHNKPIRRRYIRNPNQAEFDAGKILVFRGQEEEYDNTAFVPVEIKAGDALLIHGQVVHKSESNKSSKSRQIYTFHVVETENSEYSNENWLQTGEPFPLVYEA